MTILPSSKIVPQRRINWDHRPLLTPESMDFDIQESELPVFKLMRTSLTTTNFIIDQFLAFVLRFRRPVTMSVNTAVVIGGFIAAVLLRFDFVWPAHSQLEWASVLGAVVLVKLIVFSRYKLNEGWWRFIGIRDVPHFVMGCAVASTILVLLNLAIWKDIALPTSVFVIDWCVCTLGLLGTRLFSRLIAQSMAASGRELQHKHPLIIIGAGRGGTRVLEELSLEGGAGYHVKGFIDDDPNKAGSRIRGVDVLGTTDDLEELISSHGIQDIIVALASPGHDWLRQIMSTCERFRVRCRILPSFSEYITGKASLGQLRDIRLEDLLGRSPVQIDERHLAGAMHGRVVLVTGGAGSIGSELCRQIARFGPRILLVFDKDESGLFYMQHELKRRFPDLESCCIIGDVRNKKRLSRLFKKYPICSVFHAAAYKHVPLMEDSVYEAVSTNVLGTRNLAELAVENRCDQFVLISTDKAVRPVSVMGATKRAAELVLESIPDSNTSLVAVRFGNVLGSAGSVVPLFQKQIAAGGPVTVTHPDVTRYFMTIQEAIQLILHSSIQADQRDLFMLDMGDPVSIVELAENLIRLSGLQPNVDIPIEFSGLRPGEKLHEELLLNSEEFSKTKLPKIFRVQRMSVEATQLAQQFGKMTRLLDECNDRKLLDWLRKTVCEYRPGTHLKSLQPTVLPSTRLSQPKFQHTLDPDNSVGGTATAD